MKIIHYWIIGTKPASPSRTWLHLMLLDWHSFQQLSEAALKLFLNLLLLLEELKNLVQQLLNACCDFLKLVKQFPKLSVLR